MNIYWVHTGILVIAAVIQVFGKGELIICIATYFLVVKMDAGLIGAAIASNIAYFLAILIIFRYLKAKRYSLLHPNVWHRFNEDSMKFLGEYIRQGWQIATLKTIGVVSFKVILLYASWINQITFCTYIIVTAWTTLLVQIPYGIGTAAHNLVSLALSYNHFAKARKYAILCTIGGVFWGSLSAILFFAFREIIATLNTDEEQIKQTFMTLGPFILIHQVLEFAQNVEYGVLKGLGSTIFAVVGTSVFMVVIGIPIPYYFCFNLGYGFKGALIGQSVAILSLILYFSVKILLKIQTLYYYAKSPSKFMNRDSSSREGGYRILSSFKI